MNIKTISLPKSRTVTWWSILVLGLLLGFVLVKPSHVAADIYIPPGDNGFGCGVQNPSHGGVGDGTQQAAGLVVNVRWKPYGGTERDDNTARVQVTTDGYSWKAPHTGGVAKMTADDSAELSLNSQETFDQVPAGCSGMGGDNWGVVLGYGKTSPNGGGWYHWALDCEETARSANPPGFTGNNIYQPYDVTGVGVPAGARAGGTWSTETVQPVNGTTTYVTVVYTEPAPTPEGGGDCTTFTSNGSKYVRKEVIITGVNNITGTDTTPSGSSSFSNPNNDIDGYVDQPVGTNESPGTYTKTWSYRPYQNTINVTVNEWDYDSTTGTWPETTNSYPVSCYSASCSINYVDGDQANPVNGTNPDGSAHHIVTAGGTMYVHGTFTNTSPAPTYLTMWAGAYLDGPNGTNNLGFVPYSGSPVGFTISLPAPGSVQTYSTTFTPQYNASESNMSGCPMSAPVYQYFNIVPSAGNPAGNPEDPTTITYTTSGQNYGPDYSVDSTASSKLTVTPPAGGLTVDGPHNVPHTYSTASDTFTYSPPVIRAGDTYCSHITINPANGWKAPPGYGDVGDQPATADSGSCLTVVNEPYAHFFGSDVNAGGGFGNGCTTDTNGSIYTYTRGSGAQTNGSGTQFGAQALGVIEGLGSANLRTGSPTGPKGLTFSNTVVVPGGGADGPGLGGKFGLSSYCVPDYFGDKPSGLTTPTLTDTAAVGATGAQYYKPPSGTLTIGAGSIGNGVNETIYVEGNVYINGPISYGSTSWSSVSDIPSLSIVVKPTSSGTGGNIYIDPGVKQLDGVYVAEPDSGGHGGIINTCSTGPGSYGVAQVYNGCKNQLTVNGALVAQKIFLDRSYSSLRYSQAGENPLGGFGSHSCGIAGGDVPAGGPTSLSDCAAEIFNFSPELYLSQPAGNPNSGPTTGKFDDITSLSPVL